MAEVNPLAAVVRRSAEEYWGCPIEDVTAHEKTAWANRRSESKAELDAILEALHG